MLENMTITDISNEDIRVTTDKQKDLLKYTCLDCKYKTNIKSQMDNHVSSEHANSEAEEPKFECGKCKHEFDKEDNYNNHVVLHDAYNESSTTKTDANKESSIDKLLEDTETSKDKPSLEEDTPIPPPASSDSSTTKSDVDKEMATEEIRDDIVTTEDIEVIGERTEIPVTIRIEEPPKISEVKIASDSVICPFCRMESKNLAALKMHKENIHNQSQFIEEKQDEIIIQGNDTCLICPHCSTIGNKIELENNISYKHGEKCKECEHDNS